MSPPRMYVPVGSRPWRLAIGLRPLDPSQWLEVDRLRASELAEKRRLVSEAHDQVVAVLPGSEQAGVELLDALVAHLEADHPGTVVRRPDGVVVDVITGDGVDPARMHPVDAAGRLVQEDLCLMERRAGAWVLTAASVCFPSRWSLAAKVGRDLSAIHAPVPGYEDALAGPTAALFNRLRIERPMWRLNWTLIDRPDLRQPDPGDRYRESRRISDPGRDLWFRVERQTLRRLTERPAVTFSIRTYVTALGDLLSTHPEAADALHATLTTVPPDTVAYKGWEAVVGPVLSWLDSRR